MNRELAQKVIDDPDNTKYINVNPSKLNYEIQGKPLSYLQSNTLELREQWYKENYPQHPDRLSYYLARASLGDPVTTEEIQKKKQSDKNNMEADKRRLEKQTKIKERRQNNKNNKKKNKQHLTMQTGEFIVKF